MIGSVSPPMTSSPHLLIIQHAPVEGPGLIAGMLAERGIHASTVGPDAPLPADAAASADGILVLGGPMGVYDVDRHPRLRDEMALLTAALAKETPILGICLGSQLLASTLGARVYPGPRKEIGWYEVTARPAAQADRLFEAAPSPFMALHWHGDVFDLPAGARHLASSALTLHQAFAYGRRAWGLLFHLEAGPSQVEAMASAFPEELASAGVSVERLTEDTRTFGDGAALLGQRVFGEWLSLLGT
jgi:GMP synthase (glutamine-hydrolysing)